MLGRYTYFTFEEDSHCLLLSSRGIPVPVCAVCEDGYTAGLGYTCSKCSAERRGVTIAVGAILVAALVAVIARSLKVLRTDAWQSAAVESFSSGSIGENRQRLVRAKASQALRVTVVSWQIITQASTASLLVIDGNCSQPDLQAPYFVHHTTCDRLRILKRKCAVTV